MISIQEAPSSLERFEEKSPFSSGREESDQEEVSVDAIVLCLLCCDAVDVVGERNANGCWIL